VVDNHLQDAHSEDSVKQQLLLLRPLQLVHHMHWKKQDYEICNNGENGVRIPRIDQVIAMAPLHFSPCLLNRHALVDTSNGGCECKEAHKRQERPASNAVESLGHYS
jgi:hypothetical protein